MLALALSASLAAAGCGGQPAGTYSVWCATPGHREAGMTMTVIVE